MAYTLKNYSELHKKISNLSERETFIQLQKQHGLFPQKAIAYKDLILGSYLFLVAMEMPDLTQAQKNVILHHAAIRHYSYFAISHLLNEFRAIFPSASVKDHHNNTEKLKTNLSIIETKIKQTKHLPPSWFTNLRDKKINCFQVTTHYTWALAMTAMRHGFPGFILAAQLFDHLANYVNHEKKYYQDADDEVDNVVSNAYEIMVICLCAAEKTLNDSTNASRNANQFYSKKYNYFDYFSKINAITALKHHYYTEYYSRYCQEFSKELSTLESNSKNFITQYYKKYQSHQDSKLTSKSLNSETQNRQCLAT